VFFACFSINAADRRYLWGAAQALLDSARKHDARQLPPAGVQATVTVTSAGRQAAGKAATAGQLADLKATAHAAGNGKLQSSNGVDTRVATESEAYRQAYKAFAAQVPPQNSIVSRLR
jgi:thromboxane-A synthase